MSVLNCATKKYIIKEMTLEIVIIIGAVGALITTLCYNIRRSRCEEINLCGASCKRTLMTENELKMDVLNKVYSEATTPKMMTRTRSEPDYNRAT
jgi:hypothetical protein